MTVRIYRSTDASAPSISGTAGTLIAVLDACLVNGYGSKTAAGWTKTYSGTNLAAYRGPSGSTQFYLRVDDTGETDSRVRGYETMSDVNTGTGPYPTDAQVSGGLYFTKSSASGSTAREWMLITNGKIFYLLVKADGTNGALLCFGDFTSYKSGDAYNSVIICQNAINTTASNGGTLTNQMSTAISSHYIARSYTQIGSSIAAGKHTDYIKSGQGSTMGASGMTYPTATDGALWFAPVWLHEPTAVVLRGYLPGFWCPMHNVPLTDGDTFTGSGDFSGKTFEAKSIRSASTIGQVFLETSDTW